MADEHEEMMKLGGPNSPITVANDDRGGSSDHSGNRGSTTSYERKKKEAIQIELQLLTCDRMAMGLASLRNCI